MLWFPFVHDLCTFGFFCYLYNLLFIDKKNNRKNRFKGKFVFSSMSIFNGVYREINGV